MKEKTTLLLSIAFCDLMLISIRKGKEKKKRSEEKERGKKREKKPHPNLKFFKNVLKIFVKIASTTKNLMSQS